MKKKSNVGGLKTAKRRIQVRQFFENTIMKVKKYSDPFDEEENDENFDESEWNIKPFKVNMKKNHKLFEKEEGKEEEEPFDDILVKHRDLAEADKFIASLKHTDQKITLQKENVFKNSNFITDCNFKDTYEKFKTESEKLNKILHDDHEDEIDDFDDFVI